MELKWIEDFLSLAETGSFSRSAELRHVTQPAFSRRIRALESWIGTYLVDRTSSPAGLTIAGKAFKSEAEQILAHMNKVRTLVHGRPASSTKTVRLALPHTFSLNLFPQLLAKVEHHFGDSTYRFVIERVEDTALVCASGDYDLLMSYDYAGCPSGIDTQRHEAATIGQDTLQPYVRAVRGRKPLFELPGRRDAPLPFLAYTPSTYLHRVVALILDHTPAFLTERYEADMIERLKTMALEGHGVAFLPQSAVRSELAQRQLAAAGDERWQINLDVRIYRERANSSPELDRLWSCFTQLTSAGLHVGTEHLLEVQ